MSTIKVTNLKHESSASDNIALDSSGRVGLALRSPDQTLFGWFRGGKTLECRLTAPVMN
jgi:hypothetical protein